MPRRHLILLLLACLGASGPLPAQTPLRGQLVGKTVQGGTVDLLHLRGQVVLVFFWSTACPVCLDKLPELRRNLDGWKGKEFHIVAVNQDRSLEDLKAYEQVLNRMVAASPQMKVVWRGDPAHKDNFGALPSHAPATFVLDRTGRIVKQVKGRMAPELWDDVADLVLN